MNPTGNTTADMIFTGLMLVLHLAALAGLGFMLGRLRCRHAVDEALAAVKESAETHKRMGSLIEQLRNDLDKARSTNAKGQGVVVRVVTEEMPEECRTNPSKWATWMNNQTRTMNMAGELAQAKIDREILTAELVKALDDRPKVQLLRDAARSAIAELYDVQDTDGMKAVSILYDALKATDPSKRTP